MGLAFTSFRILILILSTLGKLYLQSNETSLDMQLFISAYLLNFKVKDFKVSMSLVDRLMDDLMANSKSREHYLSNHQSLKK